MVTVRSTSIMGVLNKRAVGMGFGRNGGHRSLGHLSGLQVQSSKAPMRNLSIPPFHSTDCYKLP